MSFEDTPEKKESKRDKAFEIAGQLDDIFGDRLENRLTVDHSLEVLAQSIRFMGANTRERLRELSRWQNRIGNCFDFYLRLAMMSPLESSPTRVLTGQALHYFREAIMSCAILFGTVS